MELTVGLELLSRLTTGSRLGGAGTKSAEMGGTYLTSLWGAHSVMIFHKALLICYAGRWADTSAIG